jgi:glucose/arabinose dehydrogenase
MGPHARTFCACLAAIGLGACGGPATLQVEDGMGPEPTLPPPEKSLIPVVNIAPAVGWRDGGHPVAAEGTSVAAFADGLDHPRWLHVLPNGDVLVAGDVGNVIWRVTDAR